MTLNIQTLHLIPFRKLGVDALGSEMEKVRKSISEKISNGTPCLLQGDFNFDGESLKEFLPDIFSNGMEEIKTLSSTTPKGRKYDHIVYRGLKLISCEIVSDGILTDHYPIVAEFDVV